MIPLAAGASAGFWSCEPGRYEFVFDYDEFLYLIEGEVVITGSGPAGHVHPLKAGESADIPQGLTTIWDVSRRLTKYFVARAPF